MSENKDECKKIKIAAITATRAEYGLLQNILIEIQNSELAELFLYVSGTHLLKEYGYTISEIVGAGLHIRRLVDIMPDDLYLALANSEVDIDRRKFEDILDSLGEALEKSLDSAYVNEILSSKFIYKSYDNSNIEMTSETQRTNLQSALALAKFSRILEEDEVDAVIVLGDRYELLPIANACLNLQIPLIHIGGGELSYGAIDEYVRHALSKLAYLHFPSEDEFAKRIMQMGESEDRIFCLGDTGVENVCHIEYIDSQEILTELGLDTKPYYLITFHPETMSTEEENAIQLAELLRVLNEEDECSFIFTGVNADKGRDKISALLEEFAESHANAFIFGSLGIRRYLNLMRDTIAVLGNSSSALIEAPAMGVPAINVGKRQSGRRSSPNVLHASTYKEIKESLKLAKTYRFRQCCKEYGQKIMANNVAANIAKTICEKITKRQNIAKTFIDRDFSI